MNKIYEMLNYIRKVRNANSKDFKQFSIELDSMLEDKIIDGNEYSYLLGFLFGVIDTKIDYNIEEK